MEDITFYNLEEAARELDVSVEELKSMISFGKLPEVSDGGERLIPAQAVDDFYKSGSSSPVKSTMPSTDHYTDIEVAQKLNKPVSQIWRMADWGQLPAKRDEDDRRMFPKQVIDQMIVGNSISVGAKQREVKHGEEYFTLEQISHALQRDQAAVKREVKIETFNGRRLVSKKEVERVVSKRESLRQKRIRRRLPKPHLITMPVNVYSKPGESQMKTVGKKTYYSLKEAAQYLGESIEDVWMRIRNKQIPHENIKGEVYIPAIPLHDFYHDDLTKLKNEDRKTPKPPIGDIKVEEQLEVPEEVSADPSESDAGKLVELEDWVKDLQEELRVEREENSELTAELKKEKAQHDRDDADIEIRLKNLQNDKETTIAALKAETEKLRKEKQSMASNLEEEKKHRVEAENLVQNLRAQPEKEGRALISDLRDGVRGIFNPSPESERISELENEIKALKVTMRTNEAYLESELNREREGSKQDKLDIRYERDRLEAEMENLRRDSGSHIAEIEQEKKRREDAEQRAQELYAELERDRTIRPETEQWFNDLKATLNHSEAERKELGRELAQEKEKARHLEVDASLLKEIRQLLGGSLGQTKEAPGAAPTPPSPGVEKMGGDFTKEAPETLIIKTHSGETVNFRPPFTLNSKEVELIRLVAGENEITTEQIKNRINRRAADDLDILLDRLHEKGLEPIIEDNDVYHFDPNFLQSEDGGGYGFRSDSM